MDSYSNLYKLDAGYRGKIFDNMINGNDDICIVPIHSIFHKVVNIGFNRLILSIINKKVGMSDAYIQVSDEVDFQKFDLKPGMRCIVEKDRILIGNKILISLKYSKIWGGILNSKFKFSIYDVPYENIMTIKYALDRYSSENSGWRNFYKYEDFRNRILSIINNSDDAIKNTLGYGVGLTPTCDDMILGIMSVMQYCIEYRDSMQKLKYAVMDNINNTTDISAGILKIAQMGCYHEYIQETLYSLVEGNREMVNISAKKLLSVGATSGSDILAGIYLVSTMHLRD